MSRIAILTASAALLLVFVPACSGSSDAAVDPLASTESLDSAAHVVQGKSKYSKDYCIQCGDARPSFSALEQLGVQRAAETDALWECASAGYTGCGVTAVRLASCNQIGGGIDATAIECTAQATATDRPHPAGTTVTPIRGTSTYNKRYCIQCGDPRPSFGDLEELGIERAAEQAALANCANAGNLDCVVTAVRISSCNQIGGGIDSTAITCTADATAIGGR